MTLVNKTLLLLAALVVCSQQAEAADKPNILVIWGGRYRHLEHQPQ